VLNIFYISRYIGTGRPSISIRYNDIFPLWHHDLWWISDKSPWCWLLCFHRTIIIFQLYLWKETDSAVVKSNLCATVRLSFLVREDNAHHLSLNNAYFRKVMDWSIQFLCLGRLCQISDVIENCRITIFNLLEPCHGLKVKPTLLNFVLPIYAVFHKVLVVSKDKFHIISIWPIMSLFLLIQLCPFLGLCLE